MLEEMTVVSNFAQYLDNSVMMIMIILGLLFLSVVVPLFIFMYKYSASRNKPENTENISHNSTLELVWTIIPIILILVMFSISYGVFKEFRSIPDDGLKIKVLAQKWSWSYTYPNGRVENTLYVPRGENVILEMTAPEGDVIHNMFVPSFRIKEDIVPGMETRQWFNANIEGEYDVFCAEFCGTAHAYMLSKVVVVSQDEYDNWIDNESIFDPREAPASTEESTTLLDINQPSASADPVALGERVFTGNACNTCHTVDGTPGAGIAPTLQGIYGTSVTLINSSGDEVTVEVGDDYLRESIINPSALVNQGFNPLMPAYEGTIDGEDLDNLVEYLKSL